MPHICPINKCNEELLVVYIKGLPDHGGNVLTATIFRYCPNHQKFYRLIPTALEDLKAISISVPEYQGLTQMEIIE